MFIGAYSLLTMKKADFDKRIKEIPAVTVGQDNIEMVEGNLERGRSDPLELNLIPLPINPFYIVGRWIAERQAARYKRQYRLCSGKCARTRWLYRLDPAVCWFARDPGYNLRSHTAGFCLYGRHYLTQGIKTHDNCIEHNDKMCPSIKPFHIVFTTIFTACLKNF
jgi:hypothetical protein